MGRSDKPRRGSWIPRILLVDDEEINREITARILEKTGCRVDQAEDGLGAVEAAGREHYDLILMDCRLPGMDGWTAARTIRDREEPGRRVPIVAFTAGTGGDDRARAAESGMDGILSKPFEPEELRVEIAHRLRNDPPVDPLPPHSPSTEDPSKSTAPLPFDAGENPVALSRLREISSGDEEFLRTLIGIFLNDTERRISNLENALQDRETSRIIHEAHAIKGSSGHAGASVMYAIAGSIEEMEEEGRGDSIPEAMKNLRSEFHRVRSFLEKVRENREIEL